MHRSKCLRITFPLPELAKLLRKIFPVRLEYSLRAVTLLKICMLVSLISPPLRPHSIRSTMLTCLVRTAYFFVSFQAFFMCNRTVWYLQTILRCFGERSDSDSAAKCMPGDYVILCTKPQSQFFLERTLVTVPGFVRVRAVASPAVVRLQTSIRFSRW